MSLLARAFVPLWGRGNKFLWKPGGVFLACFQDFRLNFLSLFVLKFFLGKCEILNSIEKPLSKHFLIWKKCSGLWIHSKTHLVCNEKPLRKRVFISTKSRFWMYSRNHLVCNKKPFKIWIFLSKVGKVPNLWILII